MIKFNDKPFLQYVIENFVRNNYKNIIILAGYNSHQILIILVMVKFNSNYLFN